MANFDGSVFYKYFEGFMIKQELLIKIEAKRRRG